MNCVQTKLALKILQPGSLVYLMGFEKGGRAGRFSQN